MTMTNLPAEILARHVGVVDAFVIRLSYQLWGSDLPSQEGGSIELEGRRQD
jgi:hypothetical protein